MNPIFLGVDVAGSENTWVSGLILTGDNPSVFLKPHLSSLQEIVAYCDGNDVVSVAIDAQLSWALSDEKGFRSSDCRLRDLLPEGCKNWVASINSLMAVPVRGRLLADALSPVVGTILETHPRACLDLGLDEEIQTAVRHYKRGPSAKEHTATLWQHWSRRFGIRFDEVPTTDGALDSLVCATVASLFHHAPKTLLRLKHDAPEKSGRGPFYVVAPTKSPSRPDQ